MAKGKNKTCNGCRYYRIANESMSARCIILKEPRPVDTAPPYNGPIPAHKNCPIGKRILIEK